MRNKSLMMAAMLAMTMGEIFPTLPSSRRTYDGPEPPKPDDRGRRAEKDAEAMNKAEKKRQRKMAKRARHNAQGKQPATTNATRDENNG